MITPMSPKAADPRLELDAEELRRASVRAAPQVGRAPRGLDMGAVAGGLGALALGAVALLAMSGGGRSQAHAQSAPAPAPIAPQLTKVSTAPSTAPATPIDSSAADPKSQASPLLIDNTEGAGASAAKPAAAAPPAPPAKGQPSQLLSPDEQFSLRVGGDDKTAHAEHIADPSSTVVQGTMIPAVLETALNSDLPGYARAIVSRDVRSFDGEKVAIPRGSRLIGQYKSGLSSGQSRAFIIWTRLIRPDGVSIDLGSPVMDSTGQTGLSGQVNRHFFERFGGAALLSIVGALPSALAGGSSTALVINSGSGSESGASQALAADARIAPTIRVPLGTPIQVFVARDLEFGAG